jgi:hypothetical protein
MKKIFTIIASVVAFALAFYFVKELKQTYVNQKSLDDAAEKTEKFATDLLNDAKEKTTDDKTVTEIMKDESKKEFQKNMASDKSYEDKLVDAASNFYGYYLINVESRREYCEKNNTPITEFLIEFKEKNKINLEKSTKILEEKFRKDNYQFNYKTMNDLVGKSLSPLLNQDMQDIKNKLKMNDKEACQLFNDRAIQIVESIAYEKQNKIGYEMLSNAIN